MGNAIDPLKRNLVDAGFRFLEPFSIPLLKEIAEKANDALSGIQPGDRIFEPLLCEGLLGDCSVIIDRLLEVKRLCSELEHFAVQRALDSKLSRDLREVEAKLALLSLGQVEATALAAGRKAAAAKAGAKFKDDVPTGEFASSDLSTNGFAAEQVALGKVADASVERLEAMRSQLEKRATLLADYQANSEILFIEPNHPFNIGERYGHLLMLLKDDLLLLARKGVCAAAGVRDVYGFSDALPKPSGSFIEDMTMWVRRAMTHIEQAVDDQIEYDMLVPIVASSGYAQNGLMTAEAFAAAMKDGSDGVLRFSVPSSVFPRQKSVRLRGVGMTMQFDKMSTQLDLAARHSARVLLPKAKVKIGSTDYEYRRPPLIFTAISSIGSERVQWLAGGACHNLDPQGEWVIEVMPWGTDHSTGPSSRQRIKDLRMHLRVVATPDATS